jgi:Holliday junction resolvasome RuvABC endonuclease subunit
MSYIVGLDLSLTSSGIAILSDCLPTAQAVPAHQQGYDVAPAVLRSVGEDGKRADSYRTRSRRVRRQCAAIMRILDPYLGTVLALVEGPIYAGKVLPSYFDRAGLFHGVFGALDARGIPIAVVSPTTGHQFVTGKGHADKSDIVVEASKWWPDVFVHNDDEADALGYAAMGAMHVGLKLPFRPRARHYNAVATVDWPKVGG